MTSTSKRSFAMAIIAGFVALSVVPANAAVAYYVTVNTSSVSGTTGFINFQFNPGNSGSQAATANIAEFTGGSFIGVADISATSRECFPET